MLTASKFLVVRIQSDFKSRKKTGVYSGIKVLTRQICISLFKVERVAVDNTNKLKKTFVQETVSGNASSMRLDFVFTQNITNNKWGFWNAKHVNRLFVFVLWTVLYWFRVVRGDTHISAIHITQSSSSKIMLEFDLRHNNWTRNQT